MQQLTANLGETTKHWRTISHPQLRVDYPEPLETTVQPHEVMSSGNYSAMHQVVIIQQCTKSVEDPQSGRITSINTSFMDTTKGK